MMSQPSALHKAEELFSELTTMVDAAVESGSRIDELERSLFAKLMAIGHQALTAFVERHGDGDAGEQLQREEHVWRRLPEPHQRRYLSIFGPVAIRRFVYGTREGQQIEHVPLDARLGLPAGELSYLLEDWLERMCVKGAFRESVQSLTDLLGVHVKVSVETAEKHNHDMAQHAASFRAAQELPPAEEEGELLVATADGKGVPMIRPSQDNGVSPRVQHRRGKGEKANKKQMAYVGAVYSIDRFPRTPDDVLNELLRHERANDRPCPQHKRVRAEMTRPGDESQSGPLLHGPTYLFLGLALECHQRDPEHEKVLICMLDGERQLRDLQEEWLCRAVGILDIFHVNERLWEAAYCFHPERSRAAAEFVERYLRLLLEGRVHTVIRSLQQLLSTRKLQGEKRRRLEAAITYYQNNRQYMRYDEYLACGYPIGSGVAEGACRHLVKDRLEGSGMRWSLGGARAMLDTRSIYLNGDWDAFVEHRIQQEQTALYGQAA